MVRCLVTLALGATMALPAVALAQPAASDAAERPDSRAAAAGEPGGLHAFVRDVFRDYRGMLSLENAEWAAVGSVATLAFAPADQEITSAAAVPTPYALKPGGTYGNPSMQFPLAVAWWIVGHAAGSVRAADTGRDLVRAQISAASWTYAVKFAVGRTRPNGDPRSFPSGHASASFATAMTLQQHYGWKLGLPAVGVAAYTAVERVFDNKHWPSDVAFGALVGVLAGRTVTVHLRGRRIVVQPQALAGGGGVILHVLH